MNKSQKTVFNYVTSGLVVLAGIAFLCTFVFARNRGITPEDQLTRAEGVASSVDVTRSKTETYLKFTVGDYRTEYSSDDPHFEDVFAAIESGEKLTVWISTKQETLFPRKGWVPLYKVSTGGKPIVTYEEVVRDKESSGWMVLGIGVFVVALGVLGVYSNYRRSRSKTPAQPLSPRGRALLVTAVSSVVIYGVLVGVILLDQSTGEVLKKAFGRQPLGLPVKLVVFLAVTLLCLPLPWFGWHFGKLVSQSVEDGMGVGLLRVLSVSRRHPELRASQRIVWGGIAYFFLVVGAWIVYASAKGI